MELAYWNTKGLAELARRMLALFDLPYTEKNPASMEEAIALTRNNGFDFPNLPYLIDGDLKLTESSAIYLYIAHKAGKKDFFGAEGIERIKHQMVLGVMDDTVSIFWQVVNRENYAEFYETKREVLERKFQELSKFLGERQTLFCQLTFADIKLAFIISLIKTVIRAIKKTDPFAGLKNLEAHSHSVVNLPGLKEYLETNPKSKLPFFPAQYSKFECPE